jgi:hypothetical protein
LAKEEHQLISKEDPPDLDPPKEEPKAISKKIKENTIKRRPSITVGIDTTR